MYSNAEYIFFSDNYSRHFKGFRVYAGNRNGITIVSSWVAKKLAIGDLRDVKDIDISIFMVTAVKANFGLIGLHA